MYFNYKLLLSAILSSYCVFINAQSCPFSSTPVKNASATYYSAINSGNCGYESVTGPLGPGNDMICALGTKLYQNGGQCGQCFKISNSKGASVTVMAIDSCNDAGYCQRNNHFDLSPSAFSVLGSQSQGVLDNLSYIKVPCTVSGNVKVMMKDGSNPYWTSFLVYNTKVAIKQVSVKQSGSSRFTPLQRTTYNYWPSSMTAGAFQVKIESIAGEFIYVDIPSVVSRKTYEAKSQFSVTGCTMMSSIESSPSFIIHEEQQFAKEEQQFAEEEPASNSFKISVSSFIVLISFIVLLLLI